MVERIGQFRVDSHELPASQSFSLSATEMPTTRKPGHPGRSHEMKATVFEFHVPNIVMCS
jgi:hypothetical protein